MKYKCLVLDHDDTVVNSTATIHFPCFMQYLSEKYPHLTDRYDLSTYFRKNFDPGVVALFRDEIGMSDEEMKAEESYWKDYVKNHIPSAFPGMKEIIADFRAAGGYIVVASHSFEYYIRRDYEQNSLPMPDLIYGWDLPKDARKPSPFSVLDASRKLAVPVEQILVVDDLKPGYDMARSAGADFAAAGWAYDVPEIESSMRSMCDHYLKTTEELRALVFG